MLTAPKYENGDWREKGTPAKGQKTITHNINNYITTANNEVQMFYLWVCV